MDLFSNILLNILVLNFLSIVFCPSRCTALISKEKPLGKCTRLIMPRPSFRTHHPSPGCHPHPKKLAQRHTVKYFFCTMHLLLSLFPSVRTCSSERREAQRAFLSEFVPRVGGSKGKVSFGPKIVLWAASVSTPNEDDPGRGVHTLC